MSEQQMVALTDDDIVTIKAALEACARGVEHEPMTEDGWSAERFRAAYRRMSVTLTPASVEPIQRIPSPGDRWRGLTDEELTDVAIALMFFGDEVARENRGTPEQRDQFHAMAVDADRELERRKEVAAMRQALEAN